MPRSIAIDRNIYGPAAHHQQASQARAPRRLESGCSRAVRTRSGEGRILASGPAAGGQEAADEQRGALVDSADIPGGGVLQLVRYGQDYEILFGEEQLMGSWESNSEEALATLVCDRLGPGAKQILIGGLGMGFTLAAALDALPANATVVVAELVPKILSWAAGPLAHIFGDTLRDPRASIELRDVHDVIVERRDSFDAILLDVDNGPDGLINLANERLYCNWGLRAAHAALRPGGVLAIWSAYTDPAFAERLSMADFVVEEITIETDESRNDRHTIWLATRRD